MIIKTTLKKLMQARVKARTALLLSGICATFSNATAQTMDYGDAPNSFATISANSGPSHLPTSYNAAAKTATLMLGAHIDIETDGIPGTLSTGDNLNDFNDEDAITRFPLLAPGSTSYSVTLPVVNTTGAAATVTGWIDFNKSGIFDAGEFATAAVPNGATSVTLNWTGFPAVATFGYVYARFRIASNASEIALPTGAATSGEVEDHRFFIGRTVSGSVFKDANRNTRIDAGENLTSLPVPMYVYIIQAGIIVDSARVAANGTYSLRYTTGQSGTIELSTQQYPIGASSTLIDHAPPAGWVTTGENNSGTNTGNGDLNPNGIMNVSGAANLVARNFGIACKSPGTSLTYDLCANEFSVIALADFLSDEDDGGTWTQLSGSGIIFDMAASTVQLTGTATISTFQYSMPGTTDCPASSSILTINPKALPVTVQTITICQGQSVCVIHPGGNARLLNPEDTVCYTMSGVYTDTLVGAAKSGCDSIVITNLTVVPNPTLSVTNTTCSNLGAIDITSPTGAAYTYSINGTNYQASTNFTNLIPGNYTITVKNSATTCVTSSQATVVSGCILPVSLLSFDAYKAGKAARLVWVTETEQHNKGFNIEHSTDAVTWTTIGAVNSKAVNGNSNTRIQYTYMHDAPTKGNNFYRLKQIDLDAKFVYSDIRNVLFNGIGLSFYPNPVDATLLISGLEKSTTVLLYNAYGQLLNTIPVTATNVLRVDMAGLPSGVYVIKTEDANKKGNSYKVIKK